MKPRHARLRTLALLALTAAFVLAGCGFEPRGTGAATGSLPERVSIRGLATYDPLYRALAAELSRAGSKAVGEAEGAEAALHVYDHRFESRILTLDSSAHVIEYELEEAVQFHLSGPEGARRVEGQRLRVLQTVFVPPSGVLGYNREIDAVRGDMRRELARRMLARIAAQI